MDKLLEYLKTLSFYEYESIKYKVMSPQKAEQLLPTLKLEPKIEQKDPQIKNLKLSKGSVIATYRDYEKEVDPYYAYRVVI